MFSARTKSLFFDRKAVTDPADRAANRVHSQFGAYCRQRAISSMLGHAVKKFGVKAKVRNRGGSAPEGAPPYPHNGLLVKGIAFVADKKGMAGGVIIGAEKLPSKVGDAPHALEVGGPSAAWAYRRGQKSLRSTRVKKHPYMLPAFKAELQAQGGPGLPKLWSGAIRR